MIKNSHPILSSRFISTLAILAALALPGFAQRCSPDKPTVGKPIIGMTGITETVEQIMAREALNPSLFTGRIIEMPEHDEIDLYKRPNPKAPKLAQWPPPPPNYGNRGGGGGPRQLNPQLIGLSWLGGAITDTVGYVPPDTDGDIGPTQAIVCVNGLIRSFNKTTGVADGALNASTNTFFNSVRNASGTSDPQIRYDRVTGRWFVAMINVSSPYRIMIAVSSGPTITNTSSFTFYFINSVAGLADYPSLGVDPNALYVGVNQFNPGYTGTSGYVIRKSSVLTGGPIVSFAFTGLASASVDGPYAARGVDQDDPAASEGYFIGVGSISYGTVFVRRVTNPGGTPTISGNLLVSGVASTTAPLSTPALGSASPLAAIDDRLFYAQMRTNRITGLTTLWTAHHFQVNNLGVASAGGGRNGSRWYEIQNMTGAPAVRQLGTLFDPAATPTFYWFPSCAMSGQGHMALGCSRAGALNRADCATAGRFRTDSLGLIQSPTQVTFTSTAYNAQSGTSQRWGDYSLTRVDPDDDMTIWSFQEYCNSTNSWGIRVFQLLAPPPASITTVSPNTVPQGTTTNLTITGTSSNGSEFYDPGAPFARRLTASVSGSGVTVNSVTFTDPTNITLNITVDNGAATGLRSITVTNPDGQFVTATDALTITANGTQVQPNNLSVAPGIIISGGLPELLTSDDNRLVVRPGVVLVSTQDPAQIVLEGTSPFNTLSQMSINVEGNANMANIQVKTMAYNFTTSTFDVVDTRQLPLSDQSFSVSVASPSNYMDGSQLIRMKLSCRASGPILSYPWLVRFDLAGWTVSP